MNKLYTIVFGCLLLFFAGHAAGQQTFVSDAKKAELDNLSAQSNSLYQTGYQRALSLAAAHGWTINRPTKNGGMVALQGVNSLGFPVYLITHNNTIAAATT